MGSILVNMIWIDGVLKLLVEFVLSGAFCLIFVCEDLVQ
jgi:hypothetical protein